MPTITVTCAMVCEPRRSSRGDRRGWRRAPGRPAARRAPRDRRPQGSARRTTISRGIGRSAEVEAGAEPRLEERGAFFLRDDLGAGDPAKQPRDRRRLGRLGVGVDAFDRPDLDGDLAQDIALPVARGVADQGDGAEREAGEKAHDGDDDGQRVAGDRVLRHELARLAHRQAGLPAIGRKLQLVGQIGLSRRP